jgi:hypothetical protein
MQKIALLLRECTLMDILTKTQKLHFHDANGFVFKDAFSLRCHLQSLQTI